MLIRFFGFLLALFFFSVIAANPNAVFQPDFSGKPVFLPQNTPIIPLCNNPLDPSCMNQWSHQAIPLAVTGPGTGMIPTMNLFVPSFIPSGIIYDSIGDNENWRTYTPPSFSSRKRRRRRHRSRLDIGRADRRDSSDKKDAEDKDSSVQKEKDKESSAIKGVKVEFQYNTEEPNQARMVKTDEKGNTKIFEGQVAYVPVNDIKKEEPMEETSRTDVSETPPSGEEGLKPSASGKKEPVVSPRARDEPDVPDQDTVGASHRISKDTNAVSGTTKENKPGCVVINEEKTEADFCFECQRDSEKAPVLFSLIDDREGFLDSLKKYLRKVSSKAQSRIANKISGASDTITKICSPEKSLEDIIGHFEETCPPPYKKNFKKFFEKAYCESCKKGIPPEIMMAMMSIESSGKCSAVSNTTHERSAGLFQINAKVHKCRDQTGTVYEEGASDNLQCLKDPINNLNTSIDIFLDRYSRVNPTALEESQCKSWLDITDIKERDAWRRAVSAYNSGPGWVTRAIESVRDNKTLKSTRYLRGRHTRINSIYKSDEASWEELRAYYFLEKLSQGIEINNIDEVCGYYIDKECKKKVEAECKKKNDEECKARIDEECKIQEAGTGRRISCTISNLAHTEAVLGRNVKDTPPGMVEIWSQYIRNNKPDCK